MRVFCRSFLGRSPKNESRRVDPPARNGIINSALLPIDCVAITRTWWCPAREPGAWPAGRIRSGAGSGLPSSCKIISGVTTWPVYAAVRPIRASSVLLAAASPLLIGLPARIAANISSCSIWYMSPFSSRPDSATCSSPVIDVAEDVGHPLGAEDVVLDLIGGVDPVAAMVVAADVVGVFVDDREMIPDIAIFRVGARLAGRRRPSIGRAACRP